MRPGLQNVWSTEQNKRGKEKSALLWILEFTCLSSVLKTLFCFSFDKDKTLCNVLCWLCPNVCFNIKVEHWLLAAPSVTGGEERTMFLCCLCKSQFHSGNPTESDALKSWAPEWLTVTVTAWTFTGTQRSFSNSRTKPNPNTYVSI